MKWYSLAVVGFSVLCSINVLLSAHEHTRKSRARRIQESGRCSPKEYFTLSPEFNVNSSPSQLHMSFYLHSTVATSSFVVKIEGKGTIFMSIRKTEQAQGSYGVFFFFRAVASYCVAIKNQPSVSKCSLFILQSPALFIQAHNWRSARWFCSLLHHIQSTSKLISKNDFPLILCF